MCSIEFPELLATPILKSWASSVISEMLDCSNPSHRKHLFHTRLAVSAIAISSYARQLIRRIAARRGAKRAVMAVAHALLEIAYPMLKRKEDYRELGADHFDRIDGNRIRRSLVRRLERLGHKVTLEPLALTA